jgi:hypothetical protein
MDHKAMIYLKVWIVGTILRPHWRRLGESPNDRRSLVTRTNLLLFDLGYLFHAQPLRGDIHEVGDYHTSQTLGSFTNHHEFSK